VDWFVTVEGVSYTEEIGLSDCCSLEGIESIFSSFNDVLRGGVSDRKNWCKLLDCQNLPEHSH